jgi:ABC-type phosphate/phosphonate transport system substrate-binding protein
MSAMPRKEQESLDDMFNDVWGMYRRAVKDNTNGLGGLVLTTNKKTGENKFVMTFAGNQKKMQQYSQRLMPIIQSLQQETGIPVEITLAK